MTNEIKCSIEIFDQNPHKHIVKLHGIDYILYKYILFHVILNRFHTTRKYKRLESLGDKLSEIESLISWEPFRPIINEMYNNKTELGG